MCFVQAIDWLAIVKPTANNEGQKARQKKHL